MVIGLASFWGSESLVGPVQIGTYFLLSISSQVFTAFLFACVSGSITAALALSVGVPVGVGAAYYSGPIGAVLRVPLDILSTIPRYILIVLLFSIYGKGLTLLMLGCAIACVPTIAESIRSHVRTQLTEGRFLAFHAHGLSPMRILWFHFIFISARRLIKKEFITVLSLFVITEASLAYIDPFVYEGFSASWGMMLSRLFRNGHSAHPQTWLTLFWMCAFLLSLAEARRYVDDSQ